MLEDEEEKWPKKRISSSSASGICYFWPNLAFFIKHSFEYCFVKDYKNQKGRDKRFFTEIKFIYCMRK